MTITFSHIVNGNRMPLLDDEGREITLVIEAQSKTEAMNSQAVRDFCAARADDTRVRRVY